MLFAGYGGKEELMKWDVTELVYEGGEPRGEYYDDRIGEYTCGGVDYLLVKLETEDGDVEELYAERPYFPPLSILTQEEADDLRVTTNNVFPYSNEDGEFCMYDPDWEPSPSEEADVLSKLREDILQQAAKYGPKAVAAVMTAVTFSAIE